MNLDEYLNLIEQGKIPPEPPEGTSPNGFGFSAGAAGLERFKARQTCNELGLWTVIDQIWPKILADWIGSRSVLEIMAGAGWLAKALAENGVNITATDDYSWNGSDGQHKQIRYVHPVKKLHALEAIATIEADILLCSWPPYGDGTICAACRLWRPEKPIIYIGEGEGGCNAPDEFFEHFQRIDDRPAIPMQSWDSLHDHVFIGEWR